jgi:ABC-type phosphate/phosphonate transport system substrate-binding protein
MILRSNDSAAAPPPPIANARMYSATPEATAAWIALFRHVAAVANVPLDIIEHAYPLPLSDLWARNDLGCAFICGWPWVRGGARHIPIAAPAPAESGRPIYWSDIVVRADDPVPSLRAMAGARAAYTLLDSQSGFSAFRHHLIDQGEDAPEFGAVIGPLTTARRAMEAVAEGAADLAPIDSYAHALLRRHAPDLAARVRVLARTEPTPIPFLAASPDLAARPDGPDIIARLRAALLALRDKSLLQPLALLGFTDPLPREDYMQMEYRARAAESAGIYDFSEFLAPDAAT